MPCTRLHAQTRKCGYRLPLYIFEFKFNNIGTQALEQIEDRRYYEKYLTKNKAITLVGVSFNIVDKKLVLDSVSKLLD
jgi:hypothetical protein